MNKYDFISVTCITIGILIIIAVIFPNFVIQLLATLFGVLLGIPIAFYIDRKNKERRENEEKQVLLKKLRKNLNDNKKHIKDLKGYNLPYFSAELFPKDYFFQTIHLLDEDLKDKIVTIYYKLEHLTRKLDLLMNMFAITVGVTENIEDAWINFLQKTDSFKKDSIDKHIDKIVKDIEEILNKI